MAIASLSPSRKLVGARRLPHVDGRLAAGLVLIAVSVLGGLRLVAAADHTVPVVVAARALPAGHVVGPHDLTVTRIRATGPVLDGLVAGEDVSHLTGRVLLFPLARHGLVAASALAHAPRAGREITVPVDAAHALGGDIRVGERVDVLATYRKGTDAARTVTVVRGAEVVGVRRASAVFGQGTRDVNAVTLSVSPDTAVAVAFALRNAELDVVRSTGAAQPTHDSYDLTDVEASP
jgi:Flp pilus assembly protein CpaB